MTLAAVSERILGPLRRPVWAASCERGSRRLMCCCNYALYTFILLQEGFPRMCVTGRVCKGASSAFACAVVAFATLGVSLESTSAQGIPAPCYLQLLTSGDQNSSSLSSSYSIEEVFPGARIATNTHAYRGYRCQPSEQFEKFTWCTKTCSGSDALRRGNFQATYSILHGEDGVVAYVNRFQKPAYWAVDEINEDVQRFSKKIGSQPEIINLSPRDGLAKAVLATWGQLRLERLEPEVVNLFAEGKKLPAGLLVDFIGDFSRSAREGLPVYRIAGGPGFVWVASRDQNGHGILRFSAADASMYSAPLSPSPSREKPATLGGTAPHDGQLSSISGEALVRDQQTRDSLFRNLKARTSQYSFEYVVITLPSGTIPGFNMPIPVSHIRYSSTVFFAFDKYSLEPGADTVIDDFAKTILADKAIRSIVVVGHTDSIGADQYNETLSLKRATTVAKALQSKGVSDKLLGMVPMGEAQPVATNSTDQGRAQNRRVEFFISDIPAATPKAIERIKFNPCHRNDHDSAARPEDCASGPMRIPLHYLPGGETTLDLTRGALPNETRTRPPLPQEPTRERPSLRELQQ
jgi:outer membrane protein OmpA-like peptidoglycan-associated protein